MCVKYLFGGTACTGFRATFHTTQKPLLYPIDLSVQPFIPRKNRFCTQSTYPCNLSYHAKTASVPNRLIRATFHTTQKPLLYPIDLSVQPFIPRKNRFCTQSTYPCNLSYHAKTASVPNRLIRATFHTTQKPLLYPQSTYPCDRRKNPIFNLGAATFSPVLCFGSCDSVCPSV